MSTKRKYITGLLAASMLAPFFVGCANDDAADTGTGDAEVSETTDMTDGTYTGSANGYGGNVEVEVVVEDGKIADLEVTDHAESSPVYNRAMPIAKERILEAQSPEVDSVSGATFTSFAMKKAVGEALAEAGANFENITMDTNADSPDVELEDVDTQLVIVGGGPSGLAAAISAKQAGTEEVILIEKLDILSGNGKFDMNFFDMIQSEAQASVGQDYTVEDFLEAKEGAMDSDARKEVWAEGAANIDPWLRDMGIELNHPYRETGHMAEADEYAGEHIQDNLEKKAYELGVDIRPGTKGLDLIMEDGKAVGVTVGNREGHYNINADAVIMATGGFSANKELLAEYAPGAEKVETSNQMGATGDFVKIFKENDLKLTNMDELSVFKLIIKNRRDLTGAGDGFVLVNENGERFAAENSSGLELAHNILDQPNGKVFYIYDQRLKDSFYRLTKHNDELGYHTKADTLEELAEELGIDATTLEETVATYNQAIEDGMGDPFRGEDVFEEPFEMDGPFYGVQVESAIHMTKGGVAANEKAQLLNNNDEPVEGLYGSGEVVATAGAYSSSVIFGRLAGEEAAEYIQSKQ